MTFEDIAEAWKQARTRERKQLLVDVLTGPERGWFSACRAWIQDGPSPDTFPEIEKEIEKILEFMGAFHGTVARIHIECAHVAHDAHVFSGGTVESDALHALYDQFPGLPPQLPIAFFRALMEELLGKPPHEERPTIALFPLVRTDVQENITGGALAQFVLERLPGGRGEAFIAPEQAFVPMQEEFGNVFRQAPRVVGQILRDHQRRDPSEDVCVRIGYCDGTDSSQNRWIDTELTGGSGGGALTLGLWSVWTGTPLEAGIVTSFALAPPRGKGQRVAPEPDGDCHRIGGDLAKAAEIKGTKGIDGPFLVSERQPKSLDAWAEQMNLRVERAATVGEAIEIATGRTRALIEYLNALINSLDRTPWFRQGEILRASAIAVPARVLKEDTRPRREPGRGPDRDDAQEKEPAFAYVDPEIARLYEEPSRETRKTEVAWAEERGQIRRAVILGAPGGGKSFLTQITAVELAQETLKRIYEPHQPIGALPIPIHIDLSKLAQSGLSADPKEAILGLLQQQYSFSASFADWLRERLSTESCWLILDALDQVLETDRVRLKERLRAMETQGWRAHLLLTCRTANYDRAMIPWTKVTEYELAPFDPLEIRQFVRKWFREADPRGEVLVGALDRNFALAHACRGPLILTLTCLAHEEMPVTEETRRGDLYARVLRGLARRAWTENPLKKDDPHVDDLLFLLEYVGWKLFILRPEANLFTNREVIHELQSAPHPPLPLVLRQQIAGGGLHPAVLAQSPTLLRDELRDSGILVGAGLSRSGETQFSLLHRSFLEYLAACALAGEINGPACGLLNDPWSFVDNEAGDPRFDETIIFLAGKLTNPIPLLELLIDPEKDDLFRHRLCLAGRCLPEISPGAYRGPLDTWRGLMG